MINRLFKSGWRDKFAGGRKPAAGPLRQSSSPESNKAATDQSGEAQQRKAEIALIKDSEQALLAHHTLTDSSSEIRYAAAQRLRDKPLIRVTLKQLGKKDKRVARTLRGQLENLEAEQLLLKNIEEIIESIEQIGYSEQWRRDQTRLNTLHNSWNKLAGVSAEKYSRFSKASNAALGRIAQWQNKLESLKPLIEARESQCALAEDFLTQLNQRQRLSSLEAKELGETLDIFQHDWDQLETLPEQYESVLARHFQQTMSQLHKRVSFLQRNSLVADGLGRIIHKAESQLGKPHIQAEFIAKLKTDWEKQKLPEDPRLAGEYRDQFSQLSNRLNAQWEKQKHNQEKDLCNIQAWLDRIEASLAQDKLNDSEQLQAQIKKSLQGLTDIPEQQKLTLENRLHKLTPRIQELKGWRHWGTDQARNELVDEAIALKEVDHDAKTRATAVRELRSRWKKLGEIDPVSGHQLWKNFDSVCTEAYALCQAHFDAEKELRGDNLRDRKNICTEFESLHSETNWDSPDWRAIDKQMRNLQNRWRKSGPVSRRDWKSIFKRYKSAESAIESQLKNERRIDHNKRQALIEKLEALCDHDNLAEAIRIARDAQRAWQPTVTGRRSDEQKLWKRFRAAADAIFDRDKEKQKTVRQELDAVLDKKKTICIAAEKLASSAQISSSDIPRLRAQWDETESVKDRQASVLERRFEQAIQSVKTASQRGHWKQQFEQLHRLLEKHDLLEALEKALQKNGDHDLIEGFKQQWSDLKSSEDPALEIRFKKACQGSFDAQELESNTESRTSLLLDLEILLELKSPPELAEKRMQKQVDRLTGAMISKDENSSRLEPSLERIKTYYESGAVPPEQAEKFSSRLIPVVSSLEARLAKLIDGRTGA